MLFSCARRERVSQSMVPYAKRRQNIQGRPHRVDAYPRFSHGDCPTAKVDVPFTRTPSAALSRSKDGANPAMSSTPAAPNSPSGRTPTPKQKSRHYFLKAACAVITIMLAKGMFSEHELKSYSTPSRAHMMATRIRTESRTSPVSRTVSGAVASSQSSTTPVQTPHERAVDANTARFTQATGITDKRLVAGYIAADRDKSASLSWDEIGVFNGDSDAITPT